jgi:hypothetical protein
MRKRTQRVNRAKASARDRKPSGVAGPKRKRPRPKSLVAGRSGPHARFPKTSSGTDRPLAREAQKPVSRKSPVRGKKKPESRKSDQRAKPKAASRQNAARARQPVVSVFGRRLTPHPKPRT